MPRTLSRQTLLLASLLLAAGPLSTSYALLDKTRFAAHLGVAYYAFHHWVLTPYRAGQFASGAAGRTGRLVKGGLALLFAAHEVNVAEKIAHSSKDPLLQRLDGALVSLKSSFTDLGSQLRAGQLNPAALQNLGGAVDRVGQTAAAGGQPIHDVAAPIPGL
ncbi:hypothetical protein E5F05_02340 (plasmid) [Deinococcus metallilatus]|uniref:Uncharacterized protein n=1 Tax=Deinococcus metallilatus TaxID=1211322 RepID=A0ABR6MV03_9DEIO|nr:hypothetical protein [Deinococcus metallilatus]MBB5295759.1 hypothetical protein [Deinococcus metallilatus]QBY06800.1 hypothetical protein E5F05_02340 [Deinococcus metallilatus]